MSAYCNNGNHHWRMRGKEKVISKCCDKIHHRNGIRSDNRIENLQPMTNSEHVSLHHKGIPVKCR